MKNFVKEYLTFNKRERNGIFVLVAIIILLLIYLNVSEKFLKVQPISFSNLEKQIDFQQAAVKASADSSKAEREEKYKGAYEQHMATKPFRKFFAENSVAKNKPSAQRFNFDPNGLSETDWKKLGLS